MKRPFFLTMLFLLACYCGLTAQDDKELLKQIESDAITYVREGKYQEALEGFLKVSEYTKGQRSESERSDYVFSRKQALICYYNLQRYEEGFWLGEELLQENITESEKKSILQYHIRNGYYFYWSLRSEHQNNEAIKILEKLRPFADDDMKQWMFNEYDSLGSIFYLELNFDQALICWEEACKGFHEVGNVQNEMEAWCHIGDIKKYKYDARGAVEAYKKAESLVQEDAKRFEILKEQLNLFEQIGDNESLEQTRLKMGALAASSDNANLQFKYNMYMGELAERQGDYKMAEWFYLKNEQYIKGLDNNNADRYDYYLKLCNLYIQTSRLDEALTYAYLIRKQTEETRDKNDDFFHYVWVSEIYQRMGDSVSSFQAMDTLFASLHLYTEPREAAQLYIARGRCHAAFKDYEKALSDYKTANGVLAAKYGEDDGDRVELLLRIGWMEYQLGHLEESERAYRKYAEGVRKLVGEDHLDFIRALYYQANIEALAGHIEAACADYTLAVEKLRRQIRYRLPYLNTKGREAYWESVSELLQGMASFALKAEQYQTAFTESCYDALVLSKNFLLATERSTYDIIKGEGTEDDLNDYVMIMSMQAKLGELGKDPGAHSDSILLLTAEMNERETRLAGRCRSLGDVTSFMDWDYRTVKGSLRGNDVLIDFTDFMSVTDSDRRLYAAYLVNSGQEYPSLRYLFAEDDIDPVLLLHPDLFYDERYSEQAYRLLWSPFEGEVEEGATVYYVPSQLLFQVSLESLVLVDGSLLGEHYNFVRVSSAREVASANRRLDIASATPRKRAVLYGGLQYDVDASVMAAESGRYDMSHALASRGGVMRGDSVFLELPWSRIEVDSLGRKLSRVGYAVETYSGARGTEESFLNMSGRAPRILHIATHGFYYTPEQAGETKYLQGYEDAMSLTGLAMSGCNRAWRGDELPDGVLDGILTANDIARLDLSGVDLVVLSACQSGSGKATSEGLYGLQRAFKKAGAGTVVMSLWNVYDEPGTEFMVAFYESLLGESGGDVREALKAAKLQMREKYPEPYHWAVFVVQD